MSVDARPFSTRKRLIAAAVETTTGEAASLVAGDGAFLYDNVNVVDETDNDVREKPGGYDQFSGIPGPYSARVTFDVHVHGGGGSGLPLWASRLLPACDMSLSGSTFSPANGAASLTTLTIGVYEDGRRTLVTGCQGTVKFPFRAGHFCKASFEFRGIAQPDDDTALISPTFPTVTPPRWANASAIAFGSFTPRLAQAEFDLGNDVQLREDPNDTSESGFRSAFIAGRASKMTADPEATLVATRDWKTLMRNSTEESIVAVLGSSSGNTITFTGARGQLLKSPTGNRNGIITVQGGWALNSGFTIAFA